MLFLKLRSHGHGTLVMSQSEGGIWFYIYYTLVIKPLAIQQSNGKKRIEKSEKNHQKVQEISILHNILQYVKKLHCSQWSITKYITVYFFLNLHYPIQKCLKDFFKSQQNWLTACLDSGDEM